MHVRKTSNSDSKKYPPGSFMGRLKEQKIIATLAAFIGGGWLTYNVILEQGKRYGVGQKMPSIVLFNISKTDSKSSVEIHYFMQV